MKQKIFFLFFLSLGIFFSYTVQAKNGDIDLLVSPIKYEIEAEKGETIEKIAKVTNKSLETKKIFTSKADFVANGINGNPTFLKDSYSDPNISLRDWIQIYENNFNLAPGETKEISFRIKVPENASPGGHYGAVFFSYIAEENDAFDSSGTGNVKINADFGVLILVKVNGEIIETGNSGDIGIVPSAGGIDKNNPNLQHSPFEKFRDNCVVDLSPSDTDGLCFGIEPLDELTAAKQKTDEKNKEIQTLEEKKKEFDFDFEIPFENTGNTHIKPNGEIILIDENGEQLKNIGKRNIYDENGEIKGEEIIDHIPINDNEGNVLPNSKRIFDTKWEGFGTVEKDTNKEEKIHFESPYEYFSNTSKLDRETIYPWEQIKYKEATKKIKVKIRFGYTSRENKLVDAKTIKEISVPYKEKYIGINCYFIAKALSILFGIFLFWILFFRRKKKCDYCGKKIKKKAAFCPHCGEKQKKTKRKAKKEQKEKTKKL